MENEQPDKNKEQEFIAGLYKSEQKRTFVVRIIFVFAGYIGLSLLLNSIRATAPLAFVWALIVVQFALYLGIFVISHLRAKVCGYRHSLWFLVVPLLLGRVENWEVVVLPVLVVTMLAISSKTGRVKEVTR